MIRTKKRVTKKWCEFYQIAKALSNLIGNFWCFTIAFFMCLFWLALGPYVGFSNTWQLTINTATSVITFLIVFILQNTQNRDTTILNLKIDELIKAIKSADNNRLKLDDLPEKELAKLLNEYKNLSKKE